MIIRRDPKFYPAIEWMQAQVPLYRTLTRLINLNPTLGVVSHYDWGTV